jgi:2,4-dienoyl-CoA reductase-like NADH-dependent reductase (Old Yellow Enzyme family)/thioredoxin reductase
METTSKTTFPALFSPLKIGRLILKNRIISSPMGVYDLTAEGYFTSEAVARYELLAKGGVGAVSIGESLVHSKTGNNHGRVPRLDDPGFLRGLYQCTDAIHRHGALASIELLHPGRRADPLYNAEGKTYGPSAGFCHYGDGEHEVTELTEAMIGVIVNAFGDAAEMAMLAGCDFVTVHAGHGWLLNQFLSPANNQRTDRFGGSLENRARISLMVADNIRRKCGRDFIIDFRISGDDFMEDGADQAEVAEFAKLLAEKIDMIHVSAANFNNRRASIRMFPSMFYPRGVNAFLAEEIKRHVSIPVVTVGGFNDPAHMERIVSEGRADVIALGRALLADPFLPDKALSGREDDIAYCTRCNQCMSVGFVPYVKYNLGVSHCAVNPWYGLHSQYLRKLDFEAYGRNPVSPGTVLVAGGGPAGMQAALGAAERGHEVLLAEKSDSLGGMLRFACFPEFKRDIRRYIDLLQRRIERHPRIEIRYGAAVTPAFVKALGPKALIVAIGSEPARPALPGMDDPRVVQAVDLHTGGRSAGGRVVVIGAGQVGVEEGIVLAREGRDVTLVEMSGKLARDAPYIHYLALLNEMEGLPNMRVALNMRCVGIRPEGVVCQSDSGQETVYAADTIVVAAGLLPLREEAEGFLGSAPRVLLAGDCRKTAQMAEAALSGYFAGYHIPSGPQAT